MSWRGKWGVGIARDMAAMSGESVLIGLKLHVGN